MQKVPVMLPASALIASLAIQLEIELVLPARCHIGTEGEDGSLYLAGTALPDSILTILWPAWTSTL